jgi:transcriptional regulator with XRE-family HTH domain
MAMDPATLVREARERHGLSQARLAHRARTTQSAISRIERGEEAITWERLRSLLHAVGEEPVLRSARMDYDGDATQLLDERRRPPERRLPSALRSNQSVAELRMGFAEGQRRRGDAVTVYDPERFEGRPMLAVLEEFGVEYVVIGGVAVQAHGSPRLTNDLDIVPRPALVNHSRLAEALIELEAVTRGTRPVPVTDPQRLARANGVFLSTKFGKLDVLKAELVLGGSYEDLRRNAVERPYGELTVLVAGVDDLIRMKRIAGRWQDLRDIATLTKPTDELEREADELSRWMREQLGEDS